MAKIPEYVEIEFPAGTILKLTGIPIELTTPTKIKTTVGNLELLRSWGVIGWINRKEDKTEIVWDEKY